VADASRWAGRLAGLVQSRWLLSLGAACLGVWVFLQIADELDDAHSLDRDILLAMRTPGDPADPVGPPWFEEAMRDVTALGGVTFLTLATLSVAAYLAFRQRRRLALLTLLTIGGAQLANEVVKDIFQRARPDLVPHGTAPYSSSFPSGHAMMAMVTFLTLALVLGALEPRRRTRAFLLGLAALMAALVGISRVYLGVHWPTDIAGGWALGASWAFCASLLFHHGIRKGAAPHPVAHGAEPVALPDRPE
jgi:undecaprenyl-diphosphatase